MTVFFQVVALFLMSATGFILVYKKVWNDESIATLSSMIVYIGTPCMNFSKLYAIPPRSISQDWVITFFVTLVFSCLFLGIGWWLFRRHPRDERAVYAQIAACSNCGFMGYPIMQAALGAQAVQYGVAFTSAFNIVCWSVGLSLFSSNMKEGLKKMVNPSMIAILFGLALQLTGWRLPVLLSDTINSFGNLATPVAMLIVGAYFSKLTADLMKNKSFLISCALRLIGIPALALLLLKLIGFSGDAAGVVYIATAMACASNTLVQATAYSTPRARELAVGGMALTTVVSVATIPLMLLLLPLLA